MTVDNIIKAVRLCIDEEALNYGDLEGYTDASGFDNTGNDTVLMDNIIKGKIPAALRWVTLYAPAEALSGGTSGGSVTPGSTVIDIIAEETPGTTSGSSIVNELITPAQTLVRVVRVKGSTWHRAILGDSLIKEDSDEYLQLRDTNGAEATADRPQAALVNTKQKKVEVWPYANQTFTLTYIRALTDADLANIVGSTEVNIPASVETSFIYYLAYLLCCAYGDARAKSMFDIATLNLGRTEDKQRQ